MAAEIRPDDTEGPLGVNLAHELIGSYLAGTDVDDRTLVFREALKELAEPEGLTQTYVDSLTRVYSHALIRSAEIAHDLVTVIAFLRMSMSPDFDPSNYDRDEYEATRSAAWLDVRDALPPRFTNPDSDGR
jgi:hypothetical protein